LPARCLTNRCTTHSPLFHSPPPLQDELFDESDEDDDDDEGLLDELEADLATKAAL
jgi:hypothetical protein